MKEINVTIKGNTPLLMNKYNMESGRQIGRRITKNYDPEEEAEKSAYWSSGKKRELVILSQHIYASMLNASSFHKVGKRSAKSILAGSIRIEPIEISLGTDKYEIDTRPVVIQRNRVLKSRAMLKEWQASFKIIYNEKMIANPVIIKEILEEAGQRIGLLDFRPQKGGPFGTFEIIKFDVQE